MAVKLVAERVHGPARRAIRKGLHAFNDASVGSTSIKPLTLTIRNRGKIVGGLTAEIYYGWMFINYLWLDEKHRGSRLGTSLMERAEETARARGVTNVWLDTFSFQAPGFYRKLGYRQFGKLDGYPKGFSRFWLTKAL